MNAGIGLQIGGTRLMKIQTFQFPTRPELWPNGTLDQQSQMGAGDMVSV